MSKEAKRYLNALIEAADMDDVTHTLSTKHASNCRRYVAVIKEVAGGEIPPFESFRQARVTTNIAKVKQWRVAMRNIRDGGITYSTLIKNEKTYSQIVKTEYSCGKDSLYKPNPRAITSWDELKTAMVTHIKALGLLMVNSVEDYKQVVSESDYLKIKAIHDATNIAGDFYHLTYAIVIDNLLRIESDDKLITSCQSEYQFDPSLIESTVLKLCSDATAMSLGELRS